MTPTFPFLKPKMNSYPFPKIKGHVNINTHWIVMHWDNFSYCLVASRWTSMEPNSNLWSCESHIMSWGVTACFADVCCDLHVHGHLARFWKSQYMEIGGIAVFLGKWGSLEVPIQRERIPLESHVWAEGRNDWNRIMLSCKKSLGKPDSWENGYLMLARWCQSQG